MTEHGIGWLNRPGTLGQSWSPMVGCSRDSEGCRHCYAERMAARIANAAAARLRAGQAITATQRAYMNAVRWSGDAVGEGKALPRWSGRVELVPEVLAKPLGWRKARTVFPSMTDPFHESLSNEAIAAMFGVMAAAKEHTFLVLTKRPERAREWFEWVGLYPAGSPDCCCQREAWKVGVQLPLHRVKGTLLAYPWPLRNVWLGTSVEDQATADARIPHLLQCPAAVRFVSYEPGLEAVDFERFLERRVVGPADELTGRMAAEGWSHPGGEGDHPGLDWIIVGGESGPGARRFDLAWARSTVAQCREAGVACFVKQLGTRPIEEDQVCIAINDRKGGDCTEWPEDLRIQQWPEAA